jgi:hypothetical protein
MMARATAQASRDASALFAHLEDYQDYESLPGDHEDREHAALTLERLAGHIRAGIWTVDLADLVTRGRQVEAALDAAESQ